MGVFETLQKFGILCEAFFSLKLVVSNCQIHVSLVNKALLPHVSKGFEISMDQY